MPLPVDPAGPNASPAPPSAPAPTPAERERAVDALARYYATDHLTESELQARLDRVYLAATAAELRSVLADLPAQVPAEVPKQVRAVLSGQEQKLTGVLPHLLELKARLGYVELDLTRAELQEGVTRIHVDVVAGYAEIHLPPGIEAESEGQAILGYVALKGPTPEPTPGPRRTIRITGRVIMGYTECFRKSARPLPPGIAGWIERWRRGGEEA